MSTRWWMAAAATFGLATSAAAADRDLEWLYNGGAPADHFSPATQINEGNVARLKEAWRFPMPPGGLEAQATKIGDTVYLVTTKRALVALDAVTGVPRWTFDPAVPGGQPIRGLATWRDGNRLRLVLGRENFLFLIDAATGQPVPGFGDNGRIDLRANLRGAAEDNHVYMTSPAIVYRDLLIVGTRLAENTPASPGDVRAFDAHTGKLVWTFHTIPHPGELGAETWPKDAWRTQGGANAWSGASLDEQRGIVFVNTGSPADDFYGAQRLGNNRFANSTIALDAQTGRRRWDFQQVHHDLWDSDSTSPPILTSIMRDGQRQDVAVATNKQSYIYVLDRATGRPIFPISERPFPASTVPGEVASPTQPVPALPHPLSRKRITEADLTTASPAANAEARAIYARLNGGGNPFVPLALDRDTLVVPGFGGGSEWGGMAADRAGTIYANVSNGASMTRLVDNSSAGNKPSAGGDQNGIPGLRYAFTGYGAFRLASGAPAVGEPLSTLNAVDLNSGQYRWTIPLLFGFSPAGPTVTASGLLFLTVAGNLRAYRTRDGALLWEQKLPASAGNTAAIYVAGGRQFVVVGTAGRGEPAYVAYALPEAPGTSRP